MDGRAQILAHRRKAGRSKCGLGHSQNRPSPKPALSEVEWDAKDAEEDG